MNIAFFEIDTWEQTFFDGMQSVHSVQFVQGHLGVDSAPEFENAEIISVFIYSQLTRAVLEQMPRLRMIATRSTGFDHIEIAYCEERGIKVCHVPTYGENTVAEHVFALLLCLSHHVLESADRTRRGDFSLTGLRGFDLCNKALGVIGVGNIGYHVIKIARGFGMSVLACDLEPDRGLADELGFTYTTMAELLEQSDVISIHVPGGPATRDLISTAEFEAMKKGVVLINTARGSVVDVSALVQALATGKVAAAGLDVIAEEPTIREEAELLSSVFSKRHNLETLLADHILLRMRNVVITPHNAFNTREAIAKILTTTRSNINAFVSGVPQNLVLP
jgi:D-lactate dehydrogenase